MNITSKHDQLFLAFYGGTIINCLSFLIIPNIYLLKEKTESFHPCENIRALFINELTLFIPD